MGLSEGIVAKNVAAPDVASTFIDGSERAAVHVGDVAIGRGIYRPGWQWSQHAQPLSKTTTAEHGGYVISGRMRVRTKDGMEVDLGPGDAFIVAAGHDAWVLGDEPCVALDFMQVTRERA